MKASTSYGLDRLVKKAQNLERIVEFDLVKKGTTRIETYKNRCLGYIERLGMLTNVSMAQKQAAARKIYKVYFNLQDYAGSEKETDMEVSLESLLPELDMAIVESYAAEARTGGLGFSSTRGLMLAEGLSAPKNPYWSAENSVKTQAPMYDPNYVYKPKQDVVQWRKDMKKQKEEVLRATKMQ
jgi:hypothetical protein